MVCSGAAVGACAVAQDGDAVRLWASPLRRWDWRSKAGPVLRE